MGKKRRVRLTAEERGELKGVAKGRSAACRQTHARILLVSDENQEGGPMKDREMGPGR